jgi:activating signal cointegrator complex subunit 1
MIRKEAPQKLQAETTAVKEDVISRVNRILDSVTEAHATDARDQALRVLVSSSIDLARRLSVQKAVFKVAMPQILPHQKTIFDGSEMEDIGGEDEDSLTAREICCVTFPSIVKSGDEHGGHTQFRNVVSRARVLCSPE